ncbi:hypothetical protein GCM10023219_02120 [Stakelama sediminis]|uniref:Uncharacterized protein n=1 Tax=Stakelama sediminis TaxID=463200 RepID=A0A840Z0V3_9SPHN|nr:hypothetical protein [Stakelama sediminis]MBB5719346.1 hypothetical protein [Stakelama sediminis]
MTGIRSEDSRRRGWIVAVAVGVIALLIAGGLLLWYHRDGATPAGQTAPTPVASATPSPVTGVKAMAPADQLALATKAVFGKTSGITRTVNGDQRDIKPVKLFWQGDQAILLTEASIPDGCHACAGSLGVYYLAPQGDGFTVVQRHPGAVQGSDWGQPPTAWRVSDKFGPTPVIYAERGGTNQGYTCGNFTLTALGAGGPAVVATAPLTYSNEGSILGTTKISLTGAITNIVPDKSFDVHYTGTSDFTEHYALRGGDYFLQGQSQVPAC